MSPEPDWDGVTRPQRRGGQRFLKDVIVDLGLAEREKVEQAHEAARIAGTTFEEVLLQQQVARRRSSSRGRSPSATASTTSTSRSSRSTWPRRT